MTLIGLQAVMDKPFNLLRLNSKIDYTKHNY